MNKILLTVLLTITLSACSLFPAKYDNNEYQMLVNLVVSTEELLLSCNGNGEITKALLPQLQKDARALEIYTKYSPRNKNVNNVAKILADDIREIIRHYKRKGHSKSYCGIKADFLHQKALRILEAVGKKSRK